MFGHECRQVGQIVTQHQDQTESGMVNHWGEVTPVYACECGALVWEPEKHRDSIAMTSIGLG